MLMTSELEDISKGRKRNSQKPQKKQPITLPCHHTARSHRGQSSCRMKIFRDRSDLTLSGDKRIEVLSSKDFEGLSCQR